MFEKLRPYIAPRYWISALGAFLILLGLTGGTTVAGIDLTIEDPNMGYIAIVLGFICLAGGLRLYRMFMKDANR